VWDVGVGETINIDEKGRIVIPAEIRKVIGRRKLNIEIADKDTIILRATAERNDLAEKIKKLKLIGDKNRSRVDFSDVKDVYGGKRVENP
jgi:DNA-binding transcriptional regulator/RsmH inhibitor MraZ